MRWGFPLLVLGFIGGTLFVTLHQVLPYCDEKENSKDAADVAPAQCGGGGLFPASIGPHLLKFCHLGPRESLRYFCQRRFGGTLKDYERGKE